MTSTTAPLRSLALLALLLWGHAACSDSLPPPGPQDMAPETDAADLVEGEMDAAPATLPIGAPCQERPRDCEGGALCVGHAASSHRFSCMARCEESWRPCPDGSLCLPTMAMGAVCYTGGDRPGGSACASNIECGPGLLCLGTENAGRYCMRACHWEVPVCEADERCWMIDESTGKGYCIDRLGASCTPGSACGEGLVCSQEALSEPRERELFPLGACLAVDCQGDEDCPGDGRCRPLGAAENARRVCVDGCQEDSDCRFYHDYRCVDEARCRQEATAVEDCLARVGEGGASTCWGRPQR